VKKLTIVVLALALLVACSRYDPYFGCPGDGANTLFEELGIDEVGPVRAS